MDNKKTTSETLAEIYPLIDISLALSELSPRANSGGKHFSCECPSCGQKRAYIHYSRSGVLQISCNRRDSCGYHENIWTYVQNRDTLDNKGTLEKLAEYANYDLETYQYNVSNERKDYLIKTLGIEPTYVLETSPNKFQVCYKLFESNIAKDKFEIVAKAFATHFGSDINVCSIEKLFRMPFSINKKNDFFLLLEFFIHLV